MKTTFILKLYIADKEEAVKAEDALLDSRGYAEVELNPSDADVVVATLADEDSDGASLVDMAISDLAECGVDVEGIRVEVVKVGTGNAADWMEFYGLGSGYDEDVVASAVGCISSFLANPEDIGGYIDDHYIGHLDRQELAQRLAEGDPKVKDLDDDVRACLDLEKYYRDTITNCIWSDGRGHWFWS